MSNISDDIKFECRYCGQSIEAEAKMRGVKTECPTCGKTIKVPSRQIKIRISKRYFIGGIACMAVLAVAGAFTLLPRYVAYMYNKHLSTLTENIEKQAKTD